MYCGVQGGIKGEALEGITYTEPFLVEMCPQLIFIEYKGAMRWIQELGDSINNNYPVRLLEDKLWNDRIMGHEGLASSWFSCHLVVEVN